MPQGTDLHSCDSPDLTTARFKSRIISRCLVTGKVSCLLLLHPHFKKQLTDARRGPGLPQGCARVTHELLRCSGKQKSAALLRVRTGATPTAPAKVSGLPWRLPLRAGRDTAAPGRAQRGAVPYRSATRSSGPEHGPRSAGPGCNGDERRPHGACELPPPDLSFPETQEGATGTERMGRTEHRRGKDAGWAPSVGA